MKTIYKSFFGAGIVALTMGSLVSCIEEIEPQTSTVTVKQAVEAPGSFDNFVSNLTGNLCGQFIFTGTRVYDFGYAAFFLTRDVQGQDLVPVGTNNWFDTWYQDFTYLGPNWLVTQLPWRYYYGVIKDCNNVISQAGASNYAEPAEPEKRVGAGIAYALRAMYYLDLCRMYCAQPYIAGSDTTLTTVKITETIDLNNAAVNPRMTWKESFEFILNDLDAAESLLADYNRTNVYTPDISVVYGLKARTYLEMRDWAKAEEYAKKAMTGYTMMSQDEYLSRHIVVDVRTDLQEHRCQYSGKRR